MLLRFLLTLLVFAAAAADQTAKNSSTTSTSKKSMAKTATAIIHTTAGDLKCELFHDIW
jgi:TRAP-type C4-dicarboxylate transport system substrate-binding protein